MDDQPGLLHPYRVLDLTGEQGQACGKLLADLGADVIKVEPPGGDPARRRGPFVDDESGPDRSLRWLAWNANKRSVSLDLNDAAGRDRFLRLVQSADFVLESFAPGHLDQLRLGYDKLAQINPRLILVSISPFGQSGPYRDYKATDIVCWAMSGFMSIAGEAERAPAQISDNAQSFLNACGDAAIGALIALEQRRQTGRGQHVDVSAQEATARATFQISASWDLNRRNLARGELATPARLPWMWRCRDGHVAWICSVGPGSSRRLAGFFRWLDEISEGQELRAVDWDHLPLAEMSDDDWERLRIPMAALFVDRTKQQLYDAAIRYDFGLFPSATTADTLASEQLRARDFWREVDHPRLGRSIRLPGAIARGAQAVPAETRPAPRIGEHNDEVFRELPETASVEAVPDPAASRSKPLAGIKIADFGWFMVGPMTVKPFADYGADVIHVESSIRIDGQRLSGPFQDDVPDPERCADYAQVRTGNRSIAIALNTAEGLAIAKRLVAWADIAFDNFAAGAMERFGLGHETLRELNPGLIVLSCNGQGQDGPHAASKGGGGHYAALAGFNEITGWTEGEPGYLSAYTDFIAPRFNVPLLLAALDHRRRTGEGQYFDVSQYEAAAHWLTPSLLDCAVNGRVAERTGNRQPDAAPHGAYRCAAGRWCVIAVTNDTEWRALCGAMQSAALADDPRFATLERRKANEDDLDRIVVDWTQEREARDVMDLLQRLGVPAGVVQTGEDVLEHDPQLRHRGFFQRLEHPALGTYRAPQHSFRLSDAPCELQRARLIGEDTYEILSEVLGYRDAEIEQLALAGALQ